MAALLAGAPFAAGAENKKAQKQKPPCGQSSMAGSSNPIRIPEHAIPETEEGLRRACDSRPLMIRDIYLDASHDIVSFYIERPHLAFKIARHVLSKTPLRLEKDDETAEWLLKGASAKYTLIPLKGKKTTGLAGFQIVTSFPLLNKKLVGHGLLALHARPGEDEGETVVEYDIRVAADPRYGDWDEAVAAYIQSSIVGDAKSLVDTLKFMSEETAYDAETLAEDMELEEDLFTKEEIRDLQKHFLADSGRR